MAYQPGFRVKAPSGSPISTISYVADSSSATSSMSITSGAQVGDLAIICSLARNSGSSWPSSVTPTNWTIYDGCGLSDSSSQGNRFMVYYKVLNSSDIGNSVSLMSATRVEHHMTIFRPDNPIASVFTGTLVYPDTVTGVPSGDVARFSSTGNIGVCTTTAVNNTGTVKLVIGYTAGSTGVPTWTGTFPTNVTGNLFTTTTRARGAYEIQSVATNRTVDPSDSGDGTYVMIGWIGIN